MNLSELKRPELSRRQRRTASVRIAKSNKWRPRKSKPSRLTSRSSPSSVILWQISAWVETLQLLQPQMQLRNESQKCYRPQMAE